MYILKMPFGNNLTRERIKEIFEKAGIHGAHGIEPQLI